MGLFERASSRVTIVEVGPRDGLQNEPVAIPTGAKVELIEHLAEAGVPLIEATAFVHPQVVPPMADAAEVLGALRRRPGTRYLALVPNAKGYERARAAGGDEVAVFIAASETFSQRNTRCSIAQSLARVHEVMALARRERVPVRGYLSTAWYCPYEGRIDPAVAVRLARTLLDAGVWQVSLGDTIGAATPREVEALLVSLLAAVPATALALHCHDTRGTALANVLVGLQLGLTTFDSSAGGLGGCPFAPGAAGNLATEDLVYLLDGMGIETGVSLGAVAQAAASIEPLGAPPRPGRAYQAVRSAARSAGLAR